MRRASKEPPLRPQAIYRRLEDLLTARRERVIVELQREKVPGLVRVRRATDAAGILYGEAAAIRQLGIDLARHGVLQAARQSPVFAAPVPGNAQGLFRSAVDLWVADTEKLFVSTSTDLVKQSRDLVIAGRAEGKTTKEIGAQIQERLQIAARRAEFIATQQADMLAARALELRHQAAGVTHFRWMSQLTKTTRPTHRRWHNMRFAYAAPPDGELPGIPPNCQCFAVPEIPDYVPVLMPSTRVFDPRTQATPNGPDPLGWLQ